MRRSRRGGSSGHEFGGSGEDSFVAVVVTKLTGALLFILLLTMVIMALIPKAVDQVRPRADGGKDTSIPLAITTPATLPEAIAGRPYAVALAAQGGKGPRQWAVDGALPEGLTLDPSSGLIRGTARLGTPKPAELVVRVKDEDGRAASRVALVVYSPDAPLTTPSRWKPGIPPIPWRSWMEQGFGFVVLLLVHLVAMNSIAGLERAAKASGSEETPHSGARFSVYRWVMRGASLAAMAGLAFWLWKAKG